MTELRKVRIDRDYEILNTPIDQIAQQIVDNTRYCFKNNIPTCRWYQPNDKTVCLVAGGPSLNQSEAFIRECVHEGHSIVAMNNTGKWLIDRGIWPGAHVLLDAREFNVKFARPSWPTTKYFVASQCHPTMFQALEDRAVWLWHGGTVKFCMPELDRMYSGQRYPVIKSGSTVTLASLYLLYLLGYRKFEVFGFDSCVMTGDHHAYEQSENEGCTDVWLSVNGRVFRLHPWMVGQLDDFCKFTKHLAHDIDIIVHGDGIIAWVIRSIAERGELVIDEVTKKVH